VGGPADRNATFTLLDGVALVVAAAVASVHMKTPVQSASGTAWVLVWVAFAGVGLTAAGPILYLARRYGRGLESYPRLGDRLWAVLGSPWIVTSPLRTSGAGADLRVFRTYGIVLTTTVVAACVIVLAVLWKKWVLTPPTARLPSKGSSSWTERLGMAISVAWPLQCGFLMVVLDSENVPLH
jgi:hypothetical protein